MRKMRKIVSLNIKGTVTKRSIDRAVREVKALRKAGKLKSSKATEVRLVG